MSRKEVTTKEGIMMIIGILENAEITYWIDGSWGADILVGKQTRNHRDISIDLDSRYAGKLSHILFEYGHEVDTDWKPVRTELYSKKYGYLDVHPFVLHEDGAAKQASLEEG